jgi:hypothetical protein
MGDKLKSGDVNRCNGTMSLLVCAQLPIPCSLSLSCLVCVGEFDILHIRRSNLEYYFIQINICL